MFELSLENVFVPSPDIAVREIEGEIVILPLKSSEYRSESDFYTLNNTGRAIWQKLDGERALKTIIEELRDEYSISDDSLQNEVFEYIKDLLNNHIIFLRGLKK